MKMITCADVVLYKKRMYRDNTGNVLPFQLMLSLRSDPCDIWDPDVVGLSPTDDEKSVVCTLAIFASLSKR